MTRAVANAPLCCPMRASMITGLHPLSHGVVGNDIRLREDVPTMAKSLTSAGYDTAYIGKWHLDGEDRSVFTPPGPRRQGFNYWMACNCNHNYMASYYYHDSPEPTWNSGYEPTAQTDSALNYLAEAAKRQEPFCLFLSWGPPHCPYRQLPDEYLRMYDVDSLRTRRNAVNPNKQVTAGYYAHITALDWNFGRLLDGIEEHGLRDSAIVVFTSDHGDMLFSHDRGWKCKPWHESVIVPFIARWPGIIPADATEDEPFGLVNVMPSILGLCGVAVPEEVEGEDLSFMLLHTDGKRPNSTPIYHYMRATAPSPDVWRGVVTRSHTYARFRDVPWVLYDDAADPYQMRNMAGKSRDSALQETLEAELRQWLARMNDSFETESDLAERLGITLDGNGIPVYYVQPHIAQEMRNRLEQLKVEC